MRTIEREIVSALIVSNDGKMLFGMKDPKKGGVYADCWHLPGGGVDEGEDKLETLRRETLEEVGIDVRDSNVSLFDDKDHGSTEKTLKDTGKVVLCKMHFNVYRVDLDKPAEEISVTLNDDLVQYCWVTREELQTIHLTQPGVALFTRLGWRT